MRPVDNLLLLGEDSKCQGIADMCGEAHKTANLLCAWGRVRGFVDGVVYLLIESEPQDVTDVGSDSCQFLERCPPVQ